MSKISLKQKILTRLKEVGDWVHKGKIETRVKEWGYLAETGDRECRLLHEAGLIDRKEEGKSIMYRYKPQEKTVTQASFKDTPQGRVAVLEQKTLFA